MPGALGLVDEADLVQRDDAEYIDDQKRPSKAAYLGQLGKLAALRAHKRQELHINIRSRQQKVRMVRTCTGHVVGISS